MTKPGIIGIALVLFPFIVQVLLESQEYQVCMVMEVLEDWEVKRGTLAERASEVQRAREGYMDKKVSTQETFMKETIFYIFKNQLGSNRPNNRPKW